MDHHLTSTLYLPSQSGPPPLPKPALANEDSDMRMDPLGPLTSLEMVNLYFSNFGKFAHRYVVPTPSRATLLGLIWIMGISGMIDLLDMKPLSGELPIDNWGVYWGTVLVGGLFAGVIGYFIQGLFYHTRVVLADGHTEWSVSARLNLFSGLPIFASSLAIALLYLGVLGEGYFRGVEHPAVDTLTAVFASGAIFVSLWLSYRGVCQVANIQPILGILLFILLPAGFYAVVAGGAMLVVEEKHKEYDAINSAALEQHTSGNYDEALRLYQQVLAEIGDRSMEYRRKALLSLAIVANAQGDFEAAKNYYRQLRQSATPGSVDYLLAEAGIHQLNNEVRDALVSLHKAYKLEPERYAILNELGVIYLGEGDEAFKNSEKALFFLERAWEMNYTNVDQCLLGKALYNLARYEEAERHFAELVADYPESSSYLIWLGVTRYELDKDEQARSDIQKAVKLDPDLRTQYITGIMNELGLE